MQKQAPPRIKYKDATYVRADVKYNIPELPTKRIYTYDEVRSRGAVEAGSAWPVSYTHLLPKGTIVPLWVDLGGWKYAADVVRFEDPDEEGFLRIDGDSAWEWEWMEGTDQEDIITFLGNEKFRRE